MIVLKAPELGKPVFTALSFALYFIVTNQHLLQQLVSEWLTALTGPCLPNTPLVLPSSSSVIDKPFISTYLAKN